MYFILVIYIFSCGIFGKPLQHGYHYKSVIKYYNIDGAEKILKHCKNYQIFMSFKHNLVIFLYHPDIYLRILETFFVAEVLTF